MKRYSTLYLRIAVVLIGLPVLAICLFWLPHAIDYLHVPVTIGAYLAAVLFFAILFKAIRLLSYIDQNKAFSTLSVTVLKQIKLFAFSISIIYAATIPFLVPIADADDAPGLMGLPLIFIFASSEVGVFAAVLERLLQDAIELKEEIDLTV